VKNKPANKKCRCRCTPSKIQEKKSQFAVVLEIGEMAVYTIQENHRGGVPSLLFIKSVI
jgi:hypothetical protein